MRLRILALAPLLLLVGLAVPQADAAATMAGPDVSKYQHDTGKPINWAAVKRSGQDFAFIKATGGSDRTDPWFAREWPAAKKAGMIRGAYHYADPRHSADAQAAHVVSVVGTTREANNLGIVLDLETSGGLSPAKLATWAHTFLNGVERRTGRVPILYTYVNFWKTKMANNRTFGAYPLWLARYGARPAPLPGWKRWTFWQYTSSHHLPGIVGTVDHNVMCCSAGTLAALADGRSTRITALWRRLGGASGTLGLPLGTETRIPGGWGQSFEHGYIASTGHGTFPVLNPVWARYRSTGGATGRLGVPVAAQEYPVRGVIRQRFSSGQVLYSSATGAHTVSGATLARWGKDGGVRSPEGLPTAEPVGVGQQFRGAGLYATRAGVFLVPGAIRDRYEDLGGPKSTYGLPTADPQAMVGARVVTFETGRLTELQVAGQHAVV